MRSNTPQVDADTLARHRQQRLAAAHQRLVAAVADLAGSAGWQRMLTIAAHLPSYSLNNILLIAAQRPDATQVAGYQTWARLGRQVRRGETGIAILAPCLTRHRVDPDRDRPVESGTRSEPGPSTDTGRAPAAAAPTGIERTAATDLEPGRLVGFRVVYVFDLTQTDGDPLPDPTPAQLRGPAPAHLWDQLAQLATVDGYRIERGPCPGAYGWTRFDERAIRIRDDLDPAHAVKTLAHELGHIRADHEHRYLDAYHRSPACRGAAEVEAESIAYLISHAAGLDTSSYSVAYLAGWSAGDTDLLTATAQRCIRVARDITEHTTTCAGLPGLDPVHRDDHPYQSPRVHPTTDLGSPSYQR